MPLWPDNLKIGSHSAAESNCDCGNKWGPCHKCPGLRVMARLHYLLWACLEGASIKDSWMRAGERIAVRTRRTSSAQILIGQYGAPGREGRTTGAAEDIEYGSWVGQFIIGFKLDTGATEIALIAKRNSF